MVSGEVKRPTATTGFVVIALARRTCSCRAASPVNRETPISTP